MMQWILLGKLLICCVLVDKSTYRGIVALDMRRVNEIYTRVLLLTDQRAHCSAGRG